MNMVKLWGKPLRCTKATQVENQKREIGANLFVGNLDASCDDKILWDCFSGFGQLTMAKVMRDPETGKSREFGFVSYDSFEASDAAMVALNGQFLCNSPITVSYAYKKDTKGERHGHAAERLVAERMQHGPGADGGSAPPPLSQMLSQGQGLAIPGGPAPSLQTAPKGGKGFAPSLPYPSAAGGAKGWGKGW